MASSVVLQQLDPLGIAAQAVGDYNTRQRSNAVDDAASKRADAQLSLQQQAGARDAQRLTDTETQQGVDNANTDRAAVAAAKKEADDEIDKAATRALNVIKEQNAKVKNDQDFAYKMKQLQNAVVVEKARAASAKDVASINAVAKTAAANIEASAHVQAAGISAAASEYGTDVRHGDAVHRDAVTKRGQDLTFQRTEHGQNLTHQDRVTAANNGLTKADQAIVATAVARLGKTKGAPPAPTDDPQFDATMADFSKMKPEDRDALLAAKKPDGTPVLPASTHAYLQALAPVFGALNH